MVWLEAVLAFSVTMMILSTMTLVIVETLHRIVRVREKGLQQMIEHLYDDIIRPKLSLRPDSPQRFGQLGTKQNARSIFSEIMTSARFLPSKKDAPCRKRVVSGMLNAEKLKTLSTLEFIERLAETDVGRRLVEESRRRGKTYLDTVITDMASKYEDFCESAREYFSRRARLISAGVAVVLAFSINVDAVNVFKSYISNHEIRAAMVARGEKIAVQLQEREEKLNELIKKPYIGDQGENIRNVQKNTEELNELFQDMLAGGVPIGWKHAPFKNKGKWEELTLYQQYITAAGWFFSVLLAGLLIGLGGPFWFDLYRRLSVFTNIFRGLQSAVQKPKEQAAQKRTAGAAEETSDPVKVFRTAAAAKALETPRGRPLLLPDGAFYKGGRTV